MENTFLQQALAQYQGKIMWQTNQQEVRILPAEYSAVDDDYSLPEKSSEKPYWTRRGWSDQEDSSDE